MKKFTGLELLIFMLLVVLFAFIAFLLYAFNAFYLSGLEFAIFWGSVFATFLSTVLAREQDERIRNGAFGALAAGGITGIVALVQENDSVVFLCYSFFGSTFGAFLGWMIFVLIAIVAYYRYGRKIVPFVELITNGFGKFREQIITLESSEVSNYLHFWFQQFAGQVQKQVSRIQQNPQLAENSQLRLEIYKATTRFALMSLIELFNLVFGTVKFRATIIRFKGDADQKVGYHAFDLSYYGIARRFKNFPFEADSKAHQMATGKISETTKTFDLNKDKNIPTRDSRDRYVSFTLYKLNDSNILSIDWAQEGAKGKLEQISGLVDEYMIPVLNILIEKVELEEQLPENR